MFPNYERLSHTVLCADFAASPLCARCPLAGDPDVVLKILDTIPSKLAHVVTLVLVVLALGIAPSAHAQTMLDETSKSAGGMLVYIGLLPAEMLRTHTPTHTEQQMHGGIPGGKHEYHLVVAVFDEKTGDRVSNAEVSARVSSLGLAGIRKRLEPMEIAGTTTYGQYFDLPGTDSYTIALDIKRAGARSSVKFDFTFHHYPPSEAE